MKKRSTCSDPLVGEIFNDKDFEPTTKHLVALYSGVLNSISVLKVSEDKTVCRCTGGDIDVPMAVKGKTVMLPSRENLKRKDNDDFQFFHPLSENVMLGESLMITTLFNYVTININSSLVNYIVAMGSIIGDPKVAEDLRVPQLEVVRKIGFKDAAFIKFTASVAKALISKISEGEYPISLYLKKKAIIKDKTYGRGCNVFMAISDLFDEDSGRFAGVKQPKKGYAAHLMKMIEAFIPNHEEPNEYSYGTFSKVAPYFCSLIGAWVNIQNKMNEAVEAFNGTEFMEDIYTDLSWCGGVPTNMEKFEKALEEMVDIVPSLDGNIGSGGAVKDSASKADKAKLVEKLIDNADERVGDREEATSSSTSKEEPAKSSKEAENDDGINPALLGGNKPNESKWGSGSNQQQSSWGRQGNNNQWNNSQQNKWNQNGNNSGWGSNNSSWGNQGNSWDNRGIMTEALSKTSGSGYSGPKF